MTKKEKAVKKHKESLKWRKATKKERAWLTEHKFTKRMQKSWGASYDEQLCSVSVESDGWFPIGYLVPRDWHIPRVMKTRQKKSPRRQQTPQSAA